MNPYPPGFNDWPEEERHAFFKAEADAYEAKKRQATKGESRDKAAKATAGNGAAADDNFNKPDEIDLEISRLAKLRTVDYEQVRREAAAKRSIRASILDKLVAAARAPDESAPGKGRPLELPAPEPWPEPVNGAALVSELTSVIRRYVVLTGNDGLTVALWVLHSYCFDAFPCTPRLAITAPEKRCGKTTLLDVIALLVPKALATANISAAALFRTVELARPILLIDEADTFLGENEELRGILNSGHRAGGQVIRTVGDDFEPRSFSTHCPVAIAQIGKLPDTLADRSIHILMKRRTPGETVARLRTGKTPELVEAARKAARWVTDNAEAIRECDPNIPDAIYNRAADNWEPLFAVAEVAGGDLPARARQAALAACGVEEEQSLGALLLSDIRDVFEERGADRIASAELVESLAAMLERPWPECRHGKPINANWLARRLRDFGIRPGNIGPKKERAKGYELIALQDAFSRYPSIPGLQSVHAATTNEIKDLDENQSVHKTKGCTLQDHANQLNLKEVAACTIQNQESGARKQFGANVTDEKMASDTVGDAWEDGF